MLVHADRCRGHEKGHDPVARRRRRHREQHHRLPEHEAQRASAVVGVDGLLDPVAIAGDQEQPRDVGAQQQQVGSGIGRGQQVAAGHRQLRPDESAQDTAQQQHRGRLGRLLRRHQLQGSEAVLVARCARPAHAKRAEAIEPERSGGQRQGADQCRADDQPAVGEKNRAAPETTEQSAGGQGRGGHTDHVQGDGQRRPTGARRKLQADDAGDEHRQRRPTHHEGVGEHQAPDGPGNVAHGQDPTSPCGVGFNSRLLSMNAEKFLPAVSPLEHAVERRHHEQGQHARDAQPRNDGRGHGPPDQ